VTLAKLCESGRELYSYMTSNSEPMARLDRAYRVAERNPRSVNAVIAGAVTASAMMYAKAYSFGTDWPALFNHRVRVQVRQTLVAEFDAEIAAGNSWLTKGTDHVKETN
jgi:hypothetical protein